MGKTMAPKQGEKLSKKRWKFTVTGSVFQSSRLELKHSNMYYVLQSSFLKVLHLPFVNASEPRHHPINVPQLTLLKNSYLAPTVIMIVR